MRAITLSCDRVAESKLLKNQQMLDELIDRLALRIAKAESGRTKSEEVTLPSEEQPEKKLNEEKATNRTKAARLKRYRKLAELCILEIYDFLYDKNINFDELGIEERYIFPDVLEDEHHY